MTFKEFDTMLFGATIIVCTDHNNLTYNTSVNDHILCQLNYVKCFGPTYIHISGDKTFLTNMFSCLHRLNDNNLLAAPSKQESYVSNFSFI